VAYGTQAWAETTRAGWGRVVVVGAVVVVVVEAVVVVVGATVVEVVVEIGARSATPDALVARSAQAPTSNPPTMTIATNVRPRQQPAASIAPPY